MPELTQPGFADSGSDTLESLLGQYNIKTKDLDPFLRAALGEQLATRQQLLGTLEDYGAGARAELEQGFTTRFHNLLGGLEERGMGASSLTASGGLALERERQLALGSLGDQLLGRRLDVLGSTASGITGLFGQMAELDVQKDLQKAQLRQQKDIADTQARLASAPDPRLLALLGAATATSQIQTPLSLGTSGGGSGPGNVLSGWLVGGKGTFSL